MEIAILGQIAKVPPLACHPQTAIPVAIEGCYVVILQGQRIVSCKILVIAIVECAVQSVGRTYPYMARRILRKGCHIWIGKMGRDLLGNKLFVWLFLGAGHSKTHKDGKD